MGHLVSVILLKLDIKIISIQSNLEEISIFITLFLVIALHRSTVRVAESADTAVAKFDSIIYTGPAVK